MQGFFVPTPLGNIKKIAESMASRYSVILFNSSV